MNVRHLSIVALIAVSFVLGCTNGCQRPSSSISAECKATTEKVSDLAKLDVAIGGGVEAVAGKSVRVNYVGQFMNCEKFDSSYDRGVPLDFKLGAGTVIEGWEKGLIGMKAGGRRVLIVPSRMAYGESGNPGGIPPNSDLRFEVELLGAD